MFRKIIFLLVLASVPFSTFASDNIKKSTQGICHDQSSPSYKRTKKFTSYPSIEACIASGGVLPKQEKEKSKSTDIKSSAGYSRSQFGAGWLDNDKDCQDSRTEALVAQSVGPVKYSSDKECRVLSGRWTSPYSGKVIYNASDIDIDHVIPLKWAWEHGADQWPQSKREELANDPANLLSVEASLNRQKGAKGLDQWMPPKNQCQYVLRFVRLYKKYQLQLSDAEEKAYENVRLKYCSK